MNVLVTGASGFIGSHLCEALLAQGDRVRALVTANSSAEHLAPLDLELVVGDVTSPESMRSAFAGVEVVYHLAGLLATFRRADFMRVNGEGTGNVARLCAAQTNPPTFVLVSSLSAAGPVARGKFRRESDPVAPVSLYGRSKLAGERAAKRLANELPMTIVRPGLVFGPRDRMTLPIFSFIARFGLHPCPGLLSPPIAMLHVSDVVELILRAGARGERVSPRRLEDRELGSGVYQGRAEKCLTYFEFGRLVAKALGHRFVPLPLPFPLPWLVAGVNEFVSRCRGQPDGLNLDAMSEAMAPSWACTGDKARNQLGFVPSKTLYERVAETVNWYRHARAF